MAHIILISDIPNKRKVTVGGLRLCADYGFVWFGFKERRGRMWQSVGLTVLVIVATLICVLLFMLFGKCPFVYAFIQSDLQVSNITSNSSHRQQNL